MQHHVNHQGSNKGKCDLRAVTFESDACGADLSEFVLTKENAICVRSHLSQTPAGPTLANLFLVDFRR